MDALSHLLKTIQLSARTYTCKGYGDDWKIQFHYRPQGIFHIVMQGQCYLREGGNSEPILLRKGDGVAFPTGGDHWISDSPDSQNLRAENVLIVGGDDGLLLVKTGDVSMGHSGIASSDLERGTAAPVAEESSQSEPATLLLNGVISYDSSINHPFLKSLPCFLQASARTDSELRIQQALATLLVDESSADHPGKPIMVDHLTEILFVQMMRVHMQNLKRPSGYMSALSDPHIGVALNLIHTETDQKWTVESLSRESAMGRTAFTAKFVDLVGMTPKAYLTNTRLMKARVKLQTSNESMLSIAESAGYASEAAFSKAIKKHFNRTPGELRKEA